MFDAIVIGVGGMGSAAVYQLARRGARVLGIEQFDIPHDLGSSHGLTRIIRLAYWEHPAYVPLLRRAYELWRGLERTAGERVLVTTGSIDAGPPGSRIVRGALRACETFDLPYERFSSLALRRRFPGYRLPAGHVALLQPQGGFLLPERCTVSHVEAAQALGASVHARERVVGWTAGRDRVHVRTDRDVYEARRIVITSGPWASKLVPCLHKLLSVERQVMLWTQPLRPVRFEPDRFPVFYMQVREGRFYGFPVHEIPGFKIGKYHHRKQLVDPDTMDRRVDAEDEAVLRQAIRRYFPDADGPTMAMKVCLFTNTRDEHFIIDVLDDSPRVAIAAGFSGHGFKFCSVVGEVLADLTLDGGTRHDTSLFALSRLARLKTKTRLQSRRQVGSRDR
jgi:sarcosine oxidase